MTVTFKDIKRAHRALRKHLQDTRIRRSHKISAIVGADIYLKFENRQHTGAFKDRGALNYLLNLSPEQKKLGIVAMSAGNHAQGVAYHAGRLGIKAIIVMPDDTPYVKIHNTENYGATVKLHGNLEQANAYALQLAKEHGYTFIHPYDSAFVIAGQGTVGIEMLKEVPDLDCLVAPIGGGGLISGMAIAAKALNPNIDIYGIQTTAYPFMKEHAEGKGIRSTGSSTIAEGIAVRKPGHLTQKIIKELVKEIFLVEEATIERALVMILDYEKTLVEGAGAASLAGILTNKKTFEGKKVGVVLSGGNIDQRILASVLMRDMVRIGRLGRLRIYMPDQPGTLADVAKIIGDCGANIVEMQYQPIFSDATVKETSIEIALETRDRQQFEIVVKTLNTKGYRTTTMSVS